MQNTRSKKSNTLVAKSTRVTSAILLGLALFLAAGMLVTGNSSCQKTSGDVQPAINGQITGEAAKAISARITDFYEAMKRLKGTQDAQAKGANFYFTLDSAAFLMEAAYNMYVVKDDDYDHDVMSFSITEPLTNGEIDEVDVADAFWRIKDSLMVLYTAVSYQGKVLDFLDLNYTVDGNDVIFEIVGAVAKNFTIYPACPDVVPNPSTTGERAYSIQGGGAPVTITIPGYAPFKYAYGQCDMISGSATNVSTSTTNPDAPTLLRSYGKYNYTCGTALACGYYTGVNTTVVTPTTVTTPTSPYAGIPGYSNRDTWHAYTFYADDQLPLTLADPNYDYKIWLTASVMNFYLDRIPTIISSNLPTGKTLKDFNVGYNRCLCAPTWNSVLNEWVLQESYTYYVTHGTYIVGCGGGSTSLPNF